MPGFRYCQWCNGKGCIACDVEQKKFEEDAMAAAPKWRPGDIRDIRDAAVKAEYLRAARGLDYLTEDQVEAEFKPLLDVEYARQFPDGPKPMFVARAGNASDMELLGNAFHRDVLERAFGDGGGGMIEIERLAVEARGTQSLRHLANPEETTP